MASDESENHQSPLSRLPRLYGHFYRGSRDPSLRRNCRRRGGLSAANKLSDLSPNRYPGWCTAILEAAFPALRTPSYFPPLVNPQLRLQYWLCQEPGLCVHGGMSCPGGLLHLPGHGDRQCCGHGDILQARKSAIHGYLGGDGDSGSARGTSHLWFRGSTRGISMDLLDSGYCMHRCRNLPRGITTNK